GRRAGRARGGARGDGDGRRPRVAPPERTEVSGMRWARTAIVAGVLLKAAVLGAWWFGALAWAERAHESAGTEETGVAPDLFAKSRGFREMLEAIRTRGEELDRREEALAAREAALASLAQALNLQLGPPEGAAPGTAATGPTAPCGVAVHKIYASMRPEEAAPILERLDHATPKTSFGCMRERQIGAILGAMRPERAVALTRVLTGGS